MVVIVEIFRVLLLYRFWFSYLYLGFGIDIVVLVDKSGEFLLSENSWGGGFNDY